MMDWKTLVASIAGSVDHELLLRLAYVVTEHPMLRNQIHGRVCLTDAERTTLAEIGKPDTILAWHRRLMPQKCDGSARRKAPGRLRIDPEVEALVLRMARENRA